MAQDRLTGAARGGVSRMGTGQVSVILAGAILVGGALAEIAGSGVRIRGGQPHHRHAQREQSRCR
jgi:hypothetical protein